MFLKLNTNVDGKPPLIINTDMIVSAYPAGDGIVELSFITGEIQVVCDFDELMRHLSTSVLSSERGPLPSPPPPPRRTGRY